MKPFNLEEAKAGAPICTRDRRSVRIICWDAKDPNFPIVALIDFPTAERVVTYDLNGQYAGDNNSQYDLFMAEEHEEYYDISNFKPFDKVLVRDHDKEHWQASFFSHYEIDNSSFPFATVNDSYAQCIPYNDETEHLVSTSDMPPKKYINW